jgi:S-DNA-T family DNA segregation ATPase FtsK/SpoIIIE
MPRKKKKETTSTFMFFEISGFIIIALSIVALTKSDSLIASVLYGINRFFLGELAFILPLLWIYVGIFAMVKRQWPVGWSKKRVGMLLLVMALLLWSHMSLFDSRLPNQELSSSTIIGETWNLVTLSDSSLNGGKEPNMGGGIVGGVFYAISYLLFANVGSYLLMLVCILISFMLMFSFSYVDLVQTFRRFFIRNSKQETKQDMKQTSNQESESDTESVVEESKNSWFKRLFVRNPTHSNQQDEEESVDEHSNDEEESNIRPVVSNQSQDFSNNLAEPLVIRDFHETETTLSMEPNETHTSHIETSSEMTDEVESPQTEAEASFVVKQLSLPLYTLPPMKLLVKPKQAGKSPEQKDMMGNARKLEKTLESFGVRAKVLEVHRGPAVTRYELQPDVGVKVSRIVSLTDDIALALAAKDIRMEAPIPGKSAIGIEVPNSEVAVVTMREVMETSAFNDSNAKLTIAFGRDISGQPIVGNLAKMPHLLVAGATGSGKSVCINGIIVSILFKAKPDEVKFLMVDPKMVELNMYNGIPHLLAPVVTDPRRASLALKKVVVEMEKRYDLFSKTGTRNIEGYNTLVKQNEGKPDTPGPLPYIVVIVDELADLMMVAASDVEDSICRLAQMARAAGIHLIIATQRPSVDVITGVIKANIPSRIAFGVSSQIDSRTILDSGGAEKLLGRGDMLYLPVGANKPMRVQGAFLSDQEVEAVVEFCKNQEQAVYQEDLVPEIEETSDATPEFEDDLFEQAVMIVLEGRQASVSYLQRRLRIGYTRAARLIDMMEAKSIVGPYEGSKPREVFMSIEQFMASRQK